jgi:hypothetical protein
VANIKGLPSVPRKKDGMEGFNSHHYQGSVSLVPLTVLDDLPLLSERVSKNLRRQAIAQAALPARQKQPRRAIPERIGEPSLIKHVVYIIKENRTYDQVFGDLRKGRGQADLCIFGPEATPNQRKMVDEFVLLDNTYCAGILSADGHQWSTTAYGTDYLEKSFAGWPRSYPDGMEDSDVDALAYAPSGFIWDAAVRRDKSVRIYGEFCKAKLSSIKPKPKDWLEAWQDRQSATTGMHHAPQQSGGSRRGLLSLPSDGSGPGDDSLAVVGHAPVSGGLHVG